MRMRMSDEQGVKSIFYNDDIGLGNNATKSPGSRVVMYIRYEFVYGFGGGEGGRGWGYL